MSKAAAPDVLVRCVCGKGYRIRRAVAGARTTCPDCGSLIEVTEADLSTGFSPDGLIRLGDDTAEARDAIPIAPEPIRPAGRGAEPGVTDRVAYTTEDSLLATALGGRGISVGTVGVGGVATPSRDESETPKRPFIQDLLASFWFAGNRNNLWNILLSAIPFVIVSLATAVTPFIFKPLPIVFMFVVIAYIVQFYWMVLRVTAKNEDEIPWFETDWDIWGDVIWPLIWVGGISVACSIPAAMLLVNTQPFPGREALFWLALAAGWFFWPVSVMSVAIGNTVLFLRPDWLVRCIWGIGPGYLVAYALAMLTVVAWQAFTFLNPVALGIAQLPYALQIVLLPLLLCVMAVANLYFGYVLFRDLGLLFRHFRARFPWKF